MPQHYVQLAGSERIPMPGAQMGAAAEPQEKMQVTVMNCARRILCRNRKRGNSGR